MKISILSRDEMTDFIARYDHNEKAVLDQHKIISIFDNDGPVFSNAHENLLGLDFHDITPGCGCDGYRLFNKEQAKEAFEFIAELKPEDDFIVHCRAGISRSGAVGTFAAMLKGQSVEALHKRHPLVYPNPWVLGLLHEAYMENEGKMLDTFRCDPGTYLVEAIAHLTRCGFFELQTSGKQLFTCDETR